MKPQRKYTSPLSPRGGEGQGEGQSSSAIAPRPPHPGPPRYEGRGWRGFVCGLLLVSSGALAQTYAPADLGQAPAGSGARILPEQFLRGYDPITVYFGSDQVPANANADDGKKRLTLTPDWPGAWSWVDRRTLQFRPAEPWPALARYQVAAGGITRTLTTMMSAPSAMAPSSGSEGLKPFRVVTLTFPQAYPVASLKKMLSLELRDLPGLADSPKKKVTGYSLSLLPRASHKDPATWSITLDDDVPEGKQLVIEVSLALGSEGTTLWQGRASTRTAFTLDAVRCGTNQFSLVGGASTPKDLALGCGNRGEQPLLVFSAPVKDLSLTNLRRLVRLEPAVPDLHFATYGPQVQLQGKFVPDTLYKLSLQSAPLTDDSGRALRDVKSADVFFHLGWRAPFLKWAHSTAMLEALGPRMLPLTGYGEPRADVRVYRVDPLHTGLWPFPADPVVVEEDAAPPFPGEEPQVAIDPGAADREALVRHLKLLGSPLVSRVVDLPLADKGNTTHFGLDLKPLLDGAVGANRPGTYLVGVRRLTGSPTRSYMRVQVTNLSITSVEETGQAVLFVRRLDDGGPVAGAVIKLEGHHDSPTRPFVSAVFTTDGAGRATLKPLTDWVDLTRVSIAKDDDVLVFDPLEQLPQFANNHWAASGEWLAWLTSTMPPPPNDANLAFVFTERPIYKPGETVFLKAFVREKRNGRLQVPQSSKRYALRVEGPDGQQWKVALTASPLMGLAGEFKEPNTPTGEFTAVLTEGIEENVLARRSFKIEAYRIPTFEVQLTAPLRTRLDAPFKAKAVARYYAGGVLSGQPITWSVTQRPYHWVPKGLDGFLFASSNQFARPTARQQGPGVIAQTGELDATGNADLTVNPQLDLDGSPRMYRFEATVTGPDDQPVTAATEVKALPAFVLGLKVPRWLEKATSLSPEVLAVGVDDKPVKGQEVRVRLFRRVWHSNLRETPFATGQAKYVTEQEDLAVADVNVVTDEKPVTKALPITESGVYVVELSSRDKLGRVQVLSADLYIGGQTPLAWPRTREGVFELKPDKAKYAPGEIAHIVVQSPYANARVLAVVEEPEGNRYTWQDVREGRSTIDVPIGDKHTPNLPMHVVLMRGRIGEGKADDGRYKPATAAASIDLEVEPLKNLVKVDLKHPESAKPGTKVDFGLTLTDDRGAPVGGEVTFWLVDEAVLSLAREGTLDPLSELVRRNSRLTSIRDTRNLVVGRVAELEDDPGGDGSDDADAAGKKRVRKNFQTVPYYAATLTVPPSGKLVVPVTLSDDLTNFRVRAVAVSGAQRFGFKQSTLRVRLPVLVQPMLPRFVRQGDRFWPGGIARLVEGAEGPATVEVRIDGKIAAKEQVKLESGKAAQVLASQVTGTAAVEGSQLTVRVDVTRHSDKAGDAFEVKLPVYPDRAVERVAWFETLKPGATKLRDFPEGARPGTASQRLVFTNQPGVLELASALEYLSAYPHGCMEQRMSQVMPDLSLAGFLKKNELETRFTPMLASNTKRLLDDIAQHQDERGFVGYWPGTRGWVSLTAQAVELMVAAKKAGVPVDEKVRSRAIAALKAVLRSDFNTAYAAYRYNDQAVALRALALAGELDEHYAIELFQHRSQLDLVSLADLTTAMSEKASVFGPNLTAMKSELWDGVVFKQVKGQPVFDKLARDRSSWEHGYLGSTTATLSAVFEALVRTDPSNTRHAQLRDAMVSRAYANTGWGSTYDNRRAVAALGVYLDQARPTEGSARVDVTGLTAVTLDAAHKAAKRETSAEAPVTVNVSGAPVAMRGYYRYLAKGPGDAVTAKRDGFIVSRSLTWYHADASAPTRHEDEPGKTLAVGLGEVLELEATLVSDAVRHHVALVVPFAAGLEPMNPELATSGADAKPAQADSVAATYVQRMDHEVRYYFTELPAGSHRFYFRVRASSEGSFVHPPPYAEQMYREEVRGRGNGTRIVVRGSRER